MGSSWQGFWGAGAPAQVLEGAAVRSNWNRSAAPLASSSVELAASAFGELGVTHVRIDLDWARIEPFAGRYDYGYLESLDQRISELKEAGLVVWLSLQQESLPGWFSEDTDGFALPGAPSIHWSRHVDTMAERFDDAAGAWLPFIDPIGWAVRTAHLGELPPFRRSSLESDRFRHHVEGAFDALAEAQRLLASGSTTTVGAFRIPAVQGPESERSYWRRLFSESWIRAITEGVLEWPWRAAIERRELADAFDAIALVADSPFVVDEQGALQRESQSPTDALGRSHDATRLDEPLHLLHERIDHPLVVMNLGVATADDEWRAASLERWLEQITAAVADGVAVSGVFLEPFVDTESTNWGIVTRDGSPKPSYRWIEAQR